jgi:hypothetical protein
MFISIRPAEILVSVSTAQGKKDMHYGARKTGHQLRASAKPCGRNNNHQSHVLCPELN